MLVHIFRDRLLLCSLACTLSAAPPRAWTSKPHQSRCTAPASPLTGSIAGSLPEPLCSFSCWPISSTLPLRNSAPHGEGSHVSNNTHAELQTSVRVLPRYASARSSDCLSRRTCPYAAVTSASGCSLPLSWNRLHPRRYCTRTLDRLICTSQSNPPPPDSPLQGWSTGK